MTMNPPKIRPSKTLEQTTREYLHACPKGATTAQVAHMFGMSNGVAYRMLKAMPDTWIASWRTTPTRMAVWKAVEVPKDAPPPSVKGAVKQVNQSPMDGIRIPE